jgi:hypothetical protein
VQSGWTDLDGKPRVLPTGGTVDIGCFEWDSSPYWVRQVGQARAVPEQFAIDLRGKPITAAFDGGFYIEETDRTAGMRVLSAQAVTPGDLATVAGQPALQGGERVLQGTAVSTQSGSPADIPGALLMVNRSLGGGDYFWNHNGENCGQQGISDAFGLNNIGLLATTCGRVTVSGRNWFYVDDGSQVQDGTGIVGVYVDAAGLSVPGKGSYAAVTGISSCEFYEGRLVNVLRARSQSDILVMSSPTGAFVATSGSKDNPRRR